jgi:hypothetical protein
MRALRIARWSLAISLVLFVAGAVANGMVGGLAPLTVLPGFLGLVVSSVLCLILQFRNRTNRNG